MSTCPFLPTLPGEQGQEMGRGMGEGQRDREKRGGAGEGVEEGRMLVRRQHRARVGK